MEIEKVKESEEKEEKVGEEVPPDWVVTYRRKTYKKDSPELAEAKRIETDRKLKSKRTVRHRPGYNSVNPYELAPRRLIAPKPIEASRAVEIAHRESTASRTSTPTAIIPTAPAVSNSDHKVTIFRNDRIPITRDDIISIHVSTAVADLNLFEKEGSNPHSISLSERDGRSFILTCNNPAAVDFYYDMANAISLESDTECANHPGFCAFKPGQLHPGHRIMGKIFRAFMPHADKMHKIFAASSAGAVLPPQVSQYRNARVDRNGMMTVYLEIDDAAFEWLRIHNWASRLGALIVSWRAPNVAGLAGIFKPDEDPAAIRDTMTMSSYATVTANAAPPPAESDGNWGDQSDEESAILHEGTGPFQTLVEELLEASSPSAGETPPPSRSAVETPSPTPVASKPPHHPPPASPTQISTIQYLESTPRGHKRECPITPTEVHPLHADYDSDMDL